MTAKTEAGSKIAVISTTCSEGNAIPQKEKQSVWTINKETLPFKLHFFLFFGAMGAILPFITVLAKTQMGLTATSLSVIYTSQQFIFIFSKPCIGFFVDHFNKLKFTIIALSVLQVIFFFLLLPIPSINFGEPDIMNLSTKIIYYQNCSEMSMIKSLALDANQNGVLRQSCRNSNCSSSSKAILCFNHEQWIRFANNASSVDSYPNVTCHPNELPLPLCPDCHMPDTPSVNSVCDVCFECQNDNPQSRDNHSVFSTYQFWLFSALLILGDMCANGLFTLSDTACYETLQKTGSDYGRQRMWGAVSWGILCPIAGFINDYTGQYLYTWCLMAILTALQIFNVSRLDLIKPNLSQSILKDIRNVFKSREFIAFAIGVFMNGVCTGVIWFYLVWFLESIGGTRFLIGISNAVQCFVGEMPFMFFSGWMIKKFGHFNILSLSSVAYFARFLAYSYTTNPWYSLPIEGLHGLTYGVFYATMTSFAKVSARPGTEATTQSVLCITYEGLGAGFGCVMAGLGFDSVGVHETFFWMSLLSAVSLAINLFNSWRVRPKKKSPAVKEVFLA